MKFIYTKTFALFSMILVVLTLGLWLQTKGWLSPIQYAILKLPQPVMAVGKSVANPIRNFFVSLFTVRTVIKDNERLSQEVAKLQSNQVELDNLKRENEALRTELNFVAKSPFGKVSCTVLTMDPDDLTDTMLLNCGSKQEIKEGNAVVAGEYLVGRIIFVGPNTSTVRLITNSQSTVDAKISRSNIDGVVKGSFGSGLVMDLVSQTADVQKGDIVTTAGIDTRVAPNILIGEVDSLVSGDNDLFKKNTIITPVKFHELKYVLVVKP